MRAAILREYGEPLEITERDAPDPGPDGAVVSVEACGLCRSDYHAWQGHGEWNDDKVPRGQVLGHEPAGEVVAVGERVRSVEVGDEVVVPFSLGDGTCRHCQTGHGNVCPNGLALGFEPEAPGAFAEQLAVPAAEYNLVDRPPEISARDAAVLGCRYMTAYHALVERAELDGGDWLAVHGCGGVGLSAVQLGRALGARVIAVDPKAGARERAETLGATATVDPSAVDPVAAIREQTGGVDVSVDALGISETCRNSIRSLRERGTHAQIGLTTESERGEISLPTDWMTRWEIDFVGARGMSPTSYTELFELLAASEVDPGALVARELSLSEVSDRLEAMHEYETTGVEVVTEL
ncbi:alcohol dehydrogenase catalytic domain-containing protein [Halovenus sp. WSH3]|uniref:Alcohol dehydrogenase catalytic domain-containing protein n=1 Tax=Halovenus carboxidivorans TaxID=2692199 RepID=A0A6B0TBS1_9EURY|nr:zinc-dependent alcohol dehydrogenase family protein [Halovenus carboxidivorans]MXR52832.1 alcohol dehydrogenase catalytic domain-containing protein [Halovenus carboxidivorans]